MYIMSHLYYNGYRMKVVSFEKEKSRSVKGYMYGVSLERANIMYQMSKSKQYIGNTNSRH